MLFVVRAQAAVERAACFRARLRREGTIARLDPQFLLPPIIEIIADQRFLHAVIAAALR